MVRYSRQSITTQTSIGNIGFHEWLLPDGKVWTQFFRSDSGYILRFPGLADFIVSKDGRDVTCSPTPVTSDDTINHLYQNQVLPLALSISGQLVFHSSAVEIDNSAVAFVGVSGRGKSTLAASFATSGFQLLADDGLLIEESDHYYVLPTEPSIRLWEDSEAALIPKEQKVAAALDYTPKSRFLAGGSIQFCTQKKTLKHVYFLGDGSPTNLQIQRMKGSEVMAELVKHSFLLDMEDKPMLTAHFNQVSRLAKQPIFYRLDFPRKYNELPRVRDTIVAHVQESTNQAA